MIIPDKGTLEYATWNALHNGLQLKRDERILIVTDEATSVVGRAFYDQAGKLTDTKPTYFVIDELKRPLLTIPDEIVSILPSIDVSVYAASSFEGEFPFRNALITQLMKNKARHGHGISLSEEIMLDGGQTDYTLIAQRCEELYSRLEKVPWMRITAPAGTDITVEFSQTTRWAQDNGVWKPALWHNIPPGEVYTSPHNAYGTIVVDGILGDHFQDTYGVISKTPITWKVANNHVVDVSCANSELEQEFRNYISGAQNRSELGELGIGVLDTKGLIGNLLQDEKMRGTVHFAVGNNLADDTGAVDNKADNHCDGVILKPTLTLANGVVLIRDGVYQH